jgi:uncharacterized membrane-anchored protein
MKKIVPLLAALLLAGAAHADAPSDKSRQFLDSLHYQDGKITLPGKIATLDLPPGFRYLPPADAQRVLHDAWGNPDGSGTLGMIVPAKGTVLDEKSWAVIVTYDKDGHVKDDDANKINYADLLKDMQKDVEDGNAERKKQGAEAVHLVGWAEAPHYDAAAHKLYWAKELDFEGNQQHTLNYNVRVLGREGVLVLNAVAGVDQLEDIKREMPAVIGFSEFTPGNRYADFNGSTDKVAEYGLAALVAGGVAAKLGFFGKLFALLLAFKKLILIGLATAGGWIYKLVTGRERKPAGQAVAEHNAADAPAAPPVNLDKS